MRALWLPRTREPLARAFGQVEHQEIVPPGIQQLERPTETSNSDRR